jgi:hypothetical protein
VRAAEGAAGVLALLLLVFFVVLALAAVVTRITASFVARIRSLCCIIVYRLALDLGLVVAAMYDIPG